MGLIEYTIVRRGSTTIRVRPDCCDSIFVERLARADDWFADPGFVLVKDTDKTKVGRVTVAIGKQAHTVFVKRYNAFSLRYRIGSLFSRSAARRSLSGAEVLRTGAIASARPVASIEVRRYGMLERSFFISEEIPGARTSDRYWRSLPGAGEGDRGFQLRRMFLRQLARLFRDLHERRIYHDDLKDANVMAYSVAGAVNFALLDLEGVRRCRHLSRRRRVKNLVQLHRTLGRYLSRPQKLVWLKYYLGGDFDNRALRRRWIADVLQLAARVERRKRGGGAAGRTAKGGLSAGRDGTKC